MKIKAMIAMISCLLATGLIMASVPMNSFQNQWITKGYITIGRNVVILPERLRLGDRIDFYDLHGVKVFEQYVGTGYLAANVSKILTGVYNLSVRRNGKVIASKEVPIIGKSK
jgi:hypothetical protein